MNDTEINMLNASNPDRVRISGHSGRLEDYKSPTASSVSVTEANFQTLSDNVDTLVCLLSELADKISPILIDDYPTESKDTAGYASPTRISERLANLCVRTDELNNRVKYLTSRVDL